MYVREVIFGRALCRCRDGKLLTMIDAIVTMTDVIVAVEF